MMVEWMVSSCVTICFVVLVRFLFRKKMQPRIRYALWLVVALRLLTPVFVSTAAVSILNLLPEPAIEETRRTEGQAMLPGTDRAGEQDAGGLSILEDNTAVSRQAQPKMTPKSNRNVKIIYEGGRGREGQKAPAFSGFMTGITDNGWLLRDIWVSGMVVCGGFLFFINLDFDLRLRRCRRRVETEKLPEEVRIPVYTAEMIQTPCLFGLFRPAIYVTEEALKEERILMFVLCHESVHYRHHDHWWVLVRNLCFCLHWYNPLVWLAAYLSRQDGELSCDEKALELLGDEVRVEYGRALLAFCAAKVSGESRRGAVSSAIERTIGTAAGGNKRQMKERLRMLVDRPEKAVWVRLALLILVAVIFAVTFTGRNGKSYAAVPEEESAQPEVKEILPEKEEEVYLPAGGGDSLVLDLNFDGYDDLCLPGLYSGGENVPYYCMIWNEERHQYEKSVMLYNIETDEENRWISCRVKVQEGIYGVTYYRYDEENRLHMVRYVEENDSPDAVFGRLDLKYVEDDGPYTLPAIVDETDLCPVLTAMGKQALMELYRWTGEKVSTACFQVTDMGSVYFSMTPEDMAHSRTFYNRDFGTDTAYNLSGYDKMISSMYISSARSVWYSPVLWKAAPAGINEMTTEEIITWYLERTPLIENCRVRKIEKNYEDIWTVETESGVWFEVFYDTGLKEIASVSGPYPDYPVH